MKPHSSLLWVALSLDAVGAVFAALLAAQLLEHNPAQALDVAGLAFGLVFLLLAWFFGGYSFLRWPWVALRELIQRWLFVVGSAVVRLCWRACC